MKLTITVILICLGFLGNAQSSIYSIQLDSLNNSGKINLSAYAGKKILIINTASLDSNAAQLTQLTQLKQLFGDSLQIIAVPSNSFGTEPAINDSIVNYYSQVSSSIAVSKKVVVNGSGIHPLYQWLVEQSQNAPVTHSFRKYLVNESGRLVGIFSRKAIPTSQAVINAIRNSRID